MRDHFRGKHKQYGTDFWASILKYKKDNKLKSYGLIGMTEDGILYKSVCFSCKLEFFVIHKSKTVWDGKINFLQINLILDNDDRFFLFNKKY